LLARVSGLEGLFVVPERQFRTISVFYKGTSNFLMKFSLIPILVLLSLMSCAQDPLDNYLKDGRYHAFTLDSGFNQHTIEILKQKLSRYRLVLLGEGGSHYLQFYEPLLFVWAGFLSEHFGMTHFFLETGHSSDLLFNHFLQTGDTTRLPKQRSLRTNIFLRGVFSFNQHLSSSKKLIPLGIDFERANSYLRAVKLLIPNTEPPKNIESIIKIIRTSNDTLNSCEYIFSFNKRLSKALKRNRDSFKQYLREKFDDLEWIVLNNASCFDVKKNRNASMAENALRFDRKFSDRLYFGQLGMAHTVLANKTTASIINSSPAFENRVCVINTYCYNCSTNEEAVSNWQLQKIEKEILSKLLKYCVSDFTLFDFSDDSPVTKKFREFGQFLIIAKNQK
jgi:hypothetical protein